MAMIIMLDLNVDLISLSKAFAVFDYAARSASREDQ